MEFGSNLKILRKANKLSQEVLAEKIGVTRQAVSRWEVGTAYPEMSNIVALCQIFHCTINDLINENTVDIESFDKETKESIVKFKINQQKNMKRISKSIYIISDIVKIILAVAFVLNFIIIVAFCCSYKNIKVIDNNIEILNQKIEYEISNNKILVGNEEFYIESSKKEIDDKFIINTFFYNYIITGIGIAIIGIFFHYLSKLYKNIHKENTPFTINNENIINKAIIFFMIQILISKLSGILYPILFKTKIVFDFNIKDILTILIIISVIYMFKYGRLIQSDSKAQIYDDEQNATF